MMLRIIKEDDDTRRFVKYNGDDKSLMLAGQALLDFFFEMREFTGESLVQGDSVHLEGTELLAHIADNIFCFDVDWDVD